MPAAGPGAASQQESGTHKLELAAGLDCCIGATSTGRGETLCPQTATFRITGKLEELKAFFEESTPSALQALYQYRDDVLQV